ncbi:hypothetical protein Pan97_07580 [Bremerella volcania]|uniref:DUF6908 domain-containing protein n=1 Tax=Bremerella volcania TaxID=2527984 RepID=A0A518C3G2_9BACT|nr:hypothetical protein [Bremerella volcania]QDU73759.1 hypothetical protein Pan97_07580 [Bremerella volcania]
MRSLNQKATKTFLKLVDGLDHVGANKKIDNAAGAFMPVCVEIIAEPSQFRNGCFVVAVTHYYESNGDLVTDPEVTFLVTAEKTVFPLTFEQGGVCYRVAAKIENGKIMFDKAAQRDLALFCNDWMANIAEQQDF